MSDRQLPLHLCRAVGQEDETVRPYVRCPRREEAMDALGCMGCERMRSVEWTPEEGGEVICDVNAPPAYVLDRRADVAEAAARAQLLDIVRPVTTCIKRDVSVGRAREVVTMHDLESIAVVDAEGRFVGLLTRTELDVFAADTPIADLVRGELRAFSATSPIGHMIAVLAFERARTIAVVTADGMLVGTCDDKAALGWVAKLLGYSPPDPSDEEPGG